MSVVKPKPNQLDGLFIGHFNLSKNIKQTSVNCLVMFITAVCLIFLLKPIRSSLNYCYLRNEKDRILMSMHLRKEYARRLIHADEKKIPQNIVSEREE